MTEKPLLTQTELNNLMQNKLTPQKVLEICQLLKTPFEIGLSSKNVEDISRRRGLYGCNLPPEVPPPLTFCQSCGKSFKQFQPRFLRNICLVYAILSIFFVSVIMILLGSNSYDAWDALHVLPVIQILLILIIPVLLDATIRHKHGRRMQGIVKSVGELKKCQVLRDGAVENLQTKDIVVGDICVFNGGDVIPVDGLKLREMPGIKCTVPPELLVHRTSEDIHFLAGSVVTEGNAELLVTSVGENTKLANWTKGTVATPLVLNFRPMLYIGIVGGMMPVLVFSTIYSFRVFIVEEQSWDMRHLQRYISYVVMGVGGFERVLPFMLPIVIIWTRFQATAQSFNFNALILENSSKYTQFILTAYLTDLLIWLISTGYVGSNFYLTAVPRLWLQILANGLALMIFPYEKIPYDFKPESMEVFSPTVIKNILGQLLYQGAVFFILLYFEIPLYVHSTMIFNTFVLMTLCNIFCARITTANSQQRNPFKGILQHKIFLCFWLLFFILQIVVCQYGGLAFIPHPLSLDELALGLFLAGGVFMWAQVLICIDAQKLFGSKTRRNRENDGANQEMLMHDETGV